MFVAGQQLCRTKDQASSIVQKVFFHFICNLGQMSISVGHCLGFEGVMKPLSLSVVVSSLGGYSPGGLN